MKNILTKSKVTIKSRVTILVVIAALPFPRPAKADQEAIKVGFLEFPPLAFGSTNSAVGAPGLVLELYESYLKKGGFRAEMQEHSILSIKESMALGKLDFFACTIPFYNGKVRDNYLRSETPFLTVTASLFQRSTEPEIKNISDLKNQKIVAVSGFESFLSKITQFNTIERVLNTSSAVNALAMGRVNYLADYKERIAELMQQKDLLKDFRVLEVERMPIYLCARRSMPGAQIHSVNFTEHVEKYKLTREGKILFQKYLFTGNFSK